LTAPDGALFPPVEAFPGRSASKFFGVRQSFWDFAPKAGEIVKVSKGASKESSKFGGRKMGKNGGRRLSFPVKPKMQNQ
jgi:hypothetical protein